jgi:sigma-70-like protein
MTYRANASLTEGSAPPHPDKVKKRRRGRRVVTDRMREIVKKYNSPDRTTFEDLGKEYGISRERVRQLLRDYELLTGVSVLRRRDHTKLKPRVTWRCSSCGIERSMTQAQLERAPKKCGKCGLVDKSLPDELVESWIKQRRQGRPWLQIAVAAGYSKTGGHTVTRTVYGYLRRKGRLGEVPDLWFNSRSMRWLAKFYPELNT